MKLIKLLLIIPMLSFISSQGTYQVNDTVLVKHVDDLLYPARITYIRGNRLTVEFLTDKSKRNINLSAVKELSWKRGQRISCFWANDGMHQWGMISKMMPDSTFWVVYDEGDVERTDYSKCRCLE